MMKKIITVSIACVLMLCGAFSIAPSFTGEVSASETGEPADDIPTGVKRFIALADDYDYRWNVNGGGNKGNEVHLDTNLGGNCEFRFDFVEREGGVAYYGIKFIKSGGTDRFVDVEDKSKDEGKVLHVWENEDDELKGDKNHHRHFAFYDAGTDANGNQCYYIKNRNSGKWVGLEKGIRKDSKLIQTSSKQYKWIISDTALSKETPDNILYTHKIQGGMALTDRRGLAEFSLR